MTRCQLCLTLSEIATDLHSQSRALAIFPLSPHSSSPPTVPSTLPIPVRVGHYALIWLILFHVVCFGPSLVMSCLCFSTPTLCGSRYISRNTD